MNTKYQFDKTEILARVKDAKSVLICSHVNPDGDTLGSALALKIFLQKLGVAADVVTPSPISDTLLWMPQADTIITDVDTISHSLTSADVIFIIDFNSLSRFGSLAESLKLSPANKIMIDHHPYPQEIANHYYSDITVSSTAELILKFMIDIWGSKYLTTDVATCVYTGILTDTGCFSYNSSNPSTFTTVAQLLELGIDKDGIYNNIFNNFSVDRMRLLGKALFVNMHVFTEHKTAYIALSKADLEESNFLPGDKEGIVNYPLSIKGIEVACLFIEKDEEVSISLRAKGKFEVNKFSSEYFNGGGHANAAGGRSLDTFDDTIAKFEKLLPNIKDGIKAK